MEEFHDLDALKAMRVIGLGGAGCNSIDRMVHTLFPGPRFIKADTDLQSLDPGSGSTIHLGKGKKNALGTGGDPELGYQAALTARKEIEEQLAGAEIVFITCGMGGGTGSGASLVVADIAKKLGALTLMIVSSPFPFEGSKKKKTALKYCEKLRNLADALIVIENAKLVSHCSRDISLNSAFLMADQTLIDSVRSFSGILGQNTYINIDYADVKSTLKSSGQAMFGYGESTGQDRAKQAIESALNNPLISQNDFINSKSLLLNIIGPADTSIQEISTVCEKIHDFSRKNDDLILGMDFRDNVKSLQVNLLAAGI